MKYTIIPETISGKLNTDLKITDEDVVRASWCYLHGELESLNGFDIFSLLKSELSENEIDASWVSDEFKEGIYPCTCFNQECTFFRWKNRKFHGLVVLNSDVTSFNYAKEQYLKKSPTI